MFYHISLARVFAVWLLSTHAAAILRPLIGVCIVHVPSLLPSYGAWECHLCRTLNIPSILTYLACFFLSTLSVCPHIWIYSYLRISAEHKCFCSAWSEINLISYSHFSVSHLLLARYHISLGGMCFGQTLCQTGTLCDCHHISFDKYIGRHSKTVAKIDLSTHFTGGERESRLN